MTEQEARKKAEEGLPEFNGNLTEYGRACYMQCFRDMCGGEPDGWCAWHPTLGIDQYAFQTSKSKIDKMKMEQCVDDGHRWQVVPVKLLRMEVGK